MRFSSLSVAVLLAGCARTVVQPGNVETTREPRPTKIIVYDFAVTASEVTVREGIAIGSGPERDSVALGHDVASALAQRLASELHEQGFVVERRARGTAIGPHELAIDGEFLDVAEGDQAKRLVIGFGAGAAKVDTAVHVTYGRTRMLDFRTHADTGKMPGAAATLGAGAAYEGVVTGTALASSAASGGYKEYQSQVERMAASSAHQAAHYLSQLFGREGWIAPDRVKKAKLD
ncbi:MAG TPA: DUF4410 domain-containing protein [Kofleriaceae bacterium]|nr:DUF4410 domain-containing protein [Kofleriaceae bacterium]